MNFITVVLVLGTLLYVKHMYINQGEKPPDVTPIECPSSFKNIIKSYELPDEMESIVIESIESNLTRNSCDKLEKWLLETNRDGKSKALAVHTYQCRCMDDVNQPFYAFKCLYLLQNKGNCTNVCGKDIAVLIGESNAGKSTCTEKINGKEMIRVPNQSTVDVNGGSNIIGHSLLSSMTRKITCFQVQDLDKLVCDTPGSRDTDGIEQQLAHGWELNSLFKNSKSIVPIYVLSTQNMNRASNFAPVWDSDIFMNKTLYETHSTIWITKAHEVIEPQQILETILTVDRSRLDEDQISIAQFLLAELQSDRSSVIVFNPLTAYRPDILNMLQSRPPTTWEQIQDRIPPEAKEVYEKDIELSEIKFRHFIEEGDYSSLEFYLEVFDKIYEYLPTDKAREAITKLKKIVENHFDNLKINYEKQANDYLHNIWNPTKSEFDKYLVQNFKEDAQRLANYIGYSLTKEDLDRSVRMVLERAINTIMLNFSPQSNECSPSKELAERVARVHAFGSPFTPLISSLDAKIADKATICFSNLQASYSNPEILNAKLTNLLDYEENFKIPSSGVPSYSNAISCYKDYVIASARNCLKGLLPATSRNAISSAEDFRSILNARLSDHWKDFDRDLRKIVNEELASYFDTADTIIASDFSHDSHDRQDSIKFIFRTVEFMKEVGFEEFPFDIKFIEKQNELEVAILNKMEGMTNLVHLVREFFREGQTSHLDFSPIRTEMEKIASFKWLENYFSVSINHYVDIVRGLVTRYFNLSLEQCENLLDQQDFIFITQNDLIFIENFNMKLETVSDCEGVIPDAEITNTANTFRSILEKYLDNVLNQRNELGSSGDLCAYLRLLTLLKESTLFCGRHNQIQTVWEELKVAFDTDWQQLYSSARADITFFGTENTIAATRVLVEKTSHIKTCLELDGPQRMEQVKAHLQNLQTLFTRRFVDCNRTNTRWCDESIRGDNSKISEWTNLRELDQDITADLDPDLIYERYRRCVELCNGDFESIFREYLALGAHDLVKWELDRCQDNNMCERYRIIVSRFMSGLRHTIENIIDLTRIPPNGEVKNFLRALSSGIAGKNTDCSDTVNAICNLFKVEKQEIEELYTDIRLIEADRRKKEYDRLLNFHLYHVPPACGNLTISVDTNNLIDDILENCLNEPAFRRSCLPERSDVSGRQGEKIDLSLSKKIKRKWASASDRFINSFLAAFRDDEIDIYPNTLSFIGQVRSENEDYYHTWNEHGILPGPNVRLLPSTLQVIKRLFENILAHDFHGGTIILDQNIVNNYNKLNSFARHNTTFSKLPQQLQDKFKDFKNQIEQIGYRLERDLQSAIDENRLYDIYLDQYELLWSIDPSSTLCKNAVQITKIHKKIIHDNLAEFNFNFGSSLENINYYNKLYLRCSKEHDNPIADIKNQLVTSSNDLLKDIDYFTYDGTNLGDFEKVVGLLDEIYSMKNILRIDMTEHKQVIRNFFDAKTKQIDLLIRTYAPSDPEFREVNELFHPLKYLVEKGPLGENFQVQWADFINNVTDLIQSRRQIGLYESLVYLAEYRYVLQEADITSKLEKIIDNLVFLPSDQEARELYEKLVASRDYYANFLAFSHRRFQNMNLCDFNNIVVRHDINYVLKHLQGEDIDTDLLFSQYESYMDTYRPLVDEYKLKLDSKMEIIEKLLQGKKLTVPKMLAHISAFWTVSNFQPEQPCLWEVHPAQLVTIFRIFELDQAQSRIDMFKSFIWGPKKSNNHIVQLGTGEGKSIVLAATASIFALLGYDVDVVCYSKYLTERDSAIFLPLFEALGVQDNIAYSTIRNLTESIINENGSIREAMKNFMLNPHVAPSAAPNVRGKRDRILLVDEVDVFFSENFLGKTHNPILILNDPLSRKLVELVWNTPIVHQVKQSAEYKNWISTHPNFKDFLDCQLERMVKDRANFNDPPFEVINSRIGYKQDDGYTTDLHYDYKTMFAYLSHRSSGEIDPAAFEENIGIRIPCGPFSFAEIPKRYKHIFGATGTLSVLTEPQKQLLKDKYEISKQTFVPSIFGTSNREFFEIEDFKIVVEGNENLDEWMIKIADEISSALAAERAILVVFKDEWVLSKFKDSPYCKPFLQNIKLLVPSTENKQDIITHAPKRATVTLMTKDFGRGSDFICRDTTVKEKGGVVVLQTFFSDDPAEDIQIPGRTARQGQKGSFKLVVHVNDLIQLGFQISDIQSKINSRTNIYREAIEARNRIFSEDIKKIDTEINTVHEVHLTTLQFHQKLLSGGHNAAEIIKIFNEIAPSCYISKGYHFIFVLDTSASMAGSPWKGLEDSVIKFVDNRRPDSINDMISVVLYDHYATIQCDSLQFTPDFNVNNCLSYRGGQTDYGAGLTAAMDVLGKNDHSTYTPLLLFLSDGVCSNGDKEMEEIRDKYSGVGLLVKVLSFGKYGDERLKEIARLGGGSFVAAVDNIELERAFVDIAENLAPGVNARIP